MGKVFFGKNEVELSVTDDVEGNNKCVEWLQQLPRPIARLVDEGLFSAVEHVQYLQPRIACRLLGESLDFEYDISDVPSGRRWEVYCDGRAQIYATASAAAAALRRRIKEASRRYR